MLIVQILRIHALIKKNDFILCLALLSLTTLGIAFSFYKLILTFQVEHNYVMVLKEDFWNYLYYFHLKPPGLLFKDKFLSLLLPINRIGAINFIILFALNFLASLQFFKALGHLKTNSLIKLIAAPLTFFLSMVFVFWRSGLHYDHYNISIHLLVISSFIKYLYEPKKWSGVWLSLALSICILVYSPGILILIPVGLALAIKNIRTIKYILPPILVFLLILLKNYSAHNLIAPSSLSGSTRLTNAYYFNDGYKGLAKHVDRNDYPQWWKDCFHFAAKNNDEFVGSLYGNCFYRPKSNKYDFEQLRSIVKPKQGSRLDLIIARDQELYANDPRIFAGPVPEFAPGFSVMYGKEASKVWMGIVKEIPKTFISFARRTFTYFTLERGSDFFSGLTYEPQYMPLKFPLPKLLKNLLKSLNYFCLILPFLLLMHMAINKRRFTTLINENHFLLTCFAGSTFLGLLGTLALLVCCENDRMYASLFPYLFLVGLSSINVFGDYIGKIANKENV